MIRYSKFISGLSYRQNVRLLVNRRNLSAEFKTHVVSPKSKGQEFLCNCDDPNVFVKCSKSVSCQHRVDQIPVYIKTYGCQMNVNDTSVVSSILEGYGYKMVDDVNESEICLLMTCAIRNSAESKVWHRISTLKRLKDDVTHPLKQIGLLGCMAERLKEKVLETDQSVDIVAGPDSYRDLPRLFAVNRMTRDRAVNCLLSLDETYSDIRPVSRVGEVTSFVSITRGCDNLCSYCIVPFTRGRERARPITSILDEIRQLMDRGVKEVTLLGQNVNSYRDITTNPESIGRSDLIELVKSKEEFADGFKTVYKPRTRGITFDVLLEEVAKLNPELRVRFTSPHPKDFTDSVIDVMSKYPNITRGVHLPAQSGSNSVLERMRRGYTRDAYLDLVDRLRSAIPELYITSDFIVGFCGETEDDHALTLDLIERVQYSFVYVFPYSQREKTHAYYKHEDNVVQETKVRRVTEIVKLFRERADRLHAQLIGTNQLVLIESKSRKSDSDWVGRTGSDVKTILPQKDLPDTISGTVRPIKPGDYVIVTITKANSQTLHGRPNCITSQLEYSSQDQMLTSNSDRQASKIQ